MLKRLIHWNNVFLKLLLFSLSIITGCGGSRLEEGPKVQSRPTAPIVCSSSLVQKGETLLRDAVLFEFNPEIQKFLRQRNNRDSIINYIELYYQSYQMGVRALRFKIEFNEAHCQLSEKDQARFGTRFAVLESAIGKVLNPLQDISEYYFKMDPLFSHNGIEDIQCAMNDPEHGKNPKTRVTNGFLLDRKDALSVILKKLKSTYDQYQQVSDLNQPSYSPEDVLAFFKKVEFFCEAFQKLDAQGECSPPPVEVQDFCNQIEELNNKLGGSYATN